jgi:CRP-like cAMP-binding protein
LSDPESETEPARLQAAEADLLLQAGRARVMPAHALLCQEGQRTDRFFVVTSGEVEIAKSIAGKLLVLSRTGPGSVLALMPALDGEPCSVSLRTLCEATVVEITRSDLFALIDPEQTARDSASNLVHALSLVAIRRLRAATDDLSQTLFQSLRSSPRAGRIDARRIARIQADNHAWPRVPLAA